MMSIDKIDMNDINNRQLIENREGYEAFEAKYGLSVELYLSTLSLQTILHIMKELGVVFTDVTEEELLEEYQYQSVVETIDGEVFEDVELLDKAIKVVKDTFGLVPSTFKKSVIDEHADMPVLSRGDLSLQPLSYSNLYNLEELRRSDVYTTYVNRGSLTTMSHTAFIAELQWQFLTSRDIQMLIYYKGSPVGTVFSYDHSPYDGRSMFSVFLSDEAPVGYGLKASMFFLEFLFEHHNLNMVSMDVYDNNEHVVNMLQKVGAEQTGHIREWRKQEDGSYVGLYRFTLYKDKVDELLKKYLK